MQIPNSIRNQIRSAQKFQYNHDERYHKDIVQLPVLDRMKHIVLHFSKYIGNMIDIDSDDTLSIGFFKKNLVDSFIMVLSASNALSIDLGTVVVNSTQNPENDAKVFRIAYVKCVGRLAKACEAIDHIENFHFRTMIEQEILNLFWIVYNKSKELDIGTLTELATIRLLEVESKHPLRWMWT